MIVLGNLVEHYGYIGIFVALILGIIGLPLPDEVLLTYVGYNVFLGRMSLYPSLLSAVLGAIIGISISYLIGYRLGLPFIKRVGPKMHLTEERILWAQSSFKKYGGFFLFIGYFIPGVRHITAYLAGMWTYRYASFALFAYIGSLFWVSLFIILGMILGNNWTIIEHLLHYTSKYVWLILFIVVFYLYFFGKKRRIDG